MMKRESLDAFVEKFAIAVDNENFDEAETWARNAFMGARQLAREGWRFPEVALYAEADEER
jgi:hypothetical protein